MAYSRQKTYHNEVSKDQEDYRAFLKLANEQKNKDFDLPTTLEYMLDLETKLVTKIKKSKNFDNIATEFFRYFSQDDCNILKLKPFFRIMSTGFAEQIFKAFRNQDKSIFNEGLNFKFFSWMESQKLNTLVYGFDSNFTKLKQARQDLCMGCIFLAVNRARIFQFQGRKTRSDALTWIDTAVEGMLAAIDKFVPGQSKKGFNLAKAFRSVAIGRMQEALMVEGASTLIKIPSNDKKILYRSNLAVNRHKLWKFEDILAFVRESFPTVTEEKLRMIMNAKSVVMESSGTDNENSSILDYLDANREQAAETIEDRLANREEHDIVRTAIESLPLLQKKLILILGGFNDYYVTKS